MSLLKGNRKRRTGRGEYGRRSGEEEKEFRAKRRKGFGRVKRRSDLGKEAERFGAKRRRGVGRWVRPISNTEETAVTRSQRQKERWVLPVGGEGNDLPTGMEAGSVEERWVLLVEGEGNDLPIGTETSSVEESWVVPSQRRRYPDIYNRKGERGDDTSASATVEAREETEAQDEIQP
ncbi:hypothetical protein ACLOJK_012312 [Asimina triloba]